MTSTRIETLNARITGTMLGIEDHGILTCMIYLDYGDSGAQGFGGWSMDYTKDGQKGGQMTGFCAKYIRSVLEVVDVGNWEDLKGKNVRARCAGGRVEAIGHILKDKWFEPRKLSEEEGM